MQPSWMIYGAYGYSGELIAREAATRGMTPILAGRNEAKLRPLANELGLGFRVFDLADGKAARRELEDMTAVLNCAGPFSQTARPMLNACLDSQTHYFDITGEIEVFELAHDPATSTRARQAGILVCPGVGFDVVPTDCLAAQLKKALPEATRLTLAFQSRSKLSPGTAKTTVEGAAELCKVRETGRIQDTYARSRTIDFGEGERSTMTIAWGDVSTAYYTTGIGTITVCIPASRKTFKRVRRMQRLRWVMARPVVQNWLKRRIEQKVSGPSKEERSENPTLLWGQVSDEAGQQRTARFRTPNGYEVTIEAPLAIIETVLAGKTTILGSVTPSQLMGDDFVWQLPGVTPLEWVD